jgi:DNA-binding response OmpR family regulator
MELLWVENHPQFARWARPFLAGCAVTVVPSLAAARAALEKSLYDVVLVDFDLEDGKGTERVLQLVAGFGRPLIVATSSHDDGNAALLRAGADAVCGKLEFARMPGLLRSLTRTHRTAGPPPADPPPGKPDTGPCP